MYIIDRLYITQLNNKQDTDCELAHYFLSNLNRLSSITITKCIEESHISKASLNRFYIRGGFKNYKDFIYELSHEYKRINSSKNEKKEKYDNCSFGFDEKIIKQLVKDIRQVKRVYFYGNINDINNFELFRYTLLKMNIEIINLLYWDFQLNYDKLMNIDENDIFILVDSQYNLNVLTEKSITQSDMIKITDVYKLKCKKYFIGVKSEHHTPFEVLGEFKTRDYLLNKVELLSLDVLLANKLEGIG